MMHCLMVTQSEIKNGRLTLYFMNASINVGITL